MVRYGFFAAPVANYRVTVAVPDPCLPEGRGPVRFRRAAVQLMTVHQEWRRKYNG